MLYYLARVMDAWSSWAEDEGARAKKDSLG